MHCDTPKQRFYASRDSACPYLPDRIERTLFTVGQGPGTSSYYSHLAQNGFRRSQNVFYRPSCPGCRECRPIRIRATEFEPSRSQRRILRRNSGLARQVTRPLSDSGQYALFSKYIRSRHLDGGMGKMDEADYTEMLEETPVRTVLVKYVDNRARMRGETGLIAAAITDILSDGLSMLYSYFDPDRSRESPGSFMIMDHVNLARRAGLDFVYLGFWVPGSKKMGYKSRFRPSEIYDGSKWRDLC